MRVSPFLMRGVSAMAIARAAEEAADRQAKREPPKPIPQRRTARGEAKREAIAFVEQETGRKVGWKGARKFIKKHRMRGPLT